MNFAIATSYKIPIIAMTMINSINVKPLGSVDFLAILLLMAIPYQPFFLDKTDTS